MFRKWKLRRFFSAWKKANVRYSKLYKELNKKLSLPFPDTVQKEIVLSMFDIELKPSNSRSYDFSDSNNLNVELKSSTQPGGGNTPFHPSQTNCDRIIYLEIDKHIDIYEFEPNYVQSTINPYLTNYVNSHPKCNEIPITLHDYINDQSIKEHKTVF